MDYGNAKVKTMAESLLPSRRRKGAIKRAHRAGHTSSRYGRSSNNRIERIEWMEQKDSCAALALLAGSHDIDTFVGRLTHTEHNEWAGAVRNLAEELSPTRARTARTIPSTAPTKSA